MQEVFIVGAARSPIGSFSGSLAKLPASEISVQIVKGLLENIQLPSTAIEEVLMGQVLTAANGQNPARQVSIKAGLDYTVPAFTVNKVCGSGLKAIQLAFQAICLKEAGIILAGGQENMSLAPHCLERSRQGQRMGDWALKDTMIIDGLWDAFNQYHMGMTAENIAKKYQISREQQDEFALHSQQKAKNAIQQNRFQQEIIPILINQQQNILFAQDEHPRFEITQASLSKLRPAFNHDGTVTAGNSSGINDGAAVVILASLNSVKQYQLKPLAKIVALASAGVDPALMGMGPIAASRQCLQKAGWSVKDLDLIEANEAFASQAICVNQQMGWDLNKVNVNGGAIALGHPIGASGCRIVVSLLHQMIKQDAKKGLATLCIGGGQGMAIALEREEKKS